MDRSTLNRWVLKYVPDVDKRIRHHLQPTNDSWRVVDTYVKIKGVWKYLYRAVDLAGNTLVFMLNAKRDGKAAVRFFRKVLKASQDPIDKDLLSLICFCNTTENYRVIL